MAIVITNGEYYIYLNEKGKHRKTDDISKAFQYDTVSAAIAYMKKAYAKTEGYYVLDTFTNHVLWKVMSEEEQILQVEQRNLRNKLVRNHNGKLKRKTYSQTTRKMLYNNACGCCQLCGRKILYSDASLDHIIPLSLGGIDDVSNLQIACVPCNRLKSNVLPETFVDKITSIFMFQMEKKCSSRIKWKIVHRMLENLI